MINVGQSKLSFSDFEEVLYKGAKVALDGGAVEKVEKNFKFLKSYAQTKSYTGSTRA
jgi:histidine ammonia-lyase